MGTSDEIKREKARDFRYKKAIVKEINIEYIRETLYAIEEDCDSVRYYCDGDEETLLNALDGDEDEAYEFKMMFADLCAECERMRDALGECYSVDEHFDDFFTAVGGGDFGGGLFGWDSYEGDYFGIDYEEFAEEESGKRMMALTKKDILNAARNCFKVYAAFCGLQRRYDNLKSAMDILKGNNTEYIKTIKEIEKAYDAAEKEGFDSWNKSTKYFKKIIAALPDVAWLQ